MKDEDDIVASIRKRRETKIWIIERILLFSVIQSVTVPDRAKATYRRMNKRKVVSRAALVHEY